MPRIAIVGGGPGGLVLARVLHRSGWDCVVFEGEAFSAARPQGWSLDMHPETGMQAIEQAGLQAEFARIARYEDQETRVYNKEGALLFEDQALGGGDRPEVDRGHLRQMLLDSLPEGMVRWDHRLSAVEPEAEGGYTLVFRNGARASFDLVVGADGTWSRVRPLVSAAKPEYSGVSFVELEIEDAEVRCPEVARLVGHGLMFAVGETKALIAHRDAHAHLGIYAGLRVPERWSAEGGLDVSSAAATRAGLLQLFAGWSGSLLELIRRSGDHIVVRGIYALPVGHRWEPRRGVTLLGDAAHVMSPFSGEGANLAMRDGLDLALALVQGEDWNGAVRRYEEMMFARAAEAAAGARQGIDEVFSDEGLAHMLQQMASHWPPSA